MQPHTQHSNATPVHSAPRIECEPDPRQPNRLAYRITGATRQCVQDVIDNLIASVDGGFGYANFVGPARCEDGYHALGQVVIYMPRVS